MCVDTVPIIGHINRTKDQATPSKPGKLANLKSQKKDYSSRTSAYQLIQNSTVYVQNAFSKNKHTTIV